MKNQILYLGNGTEIAGLDPHTVTGVPENNVISALFEGLVGEHPRDLKPIPGIAQSWKVSNNGKTYIFKLNKKAKWSNGDPILASDFVYSWQRILNAKLGAEYAYQLYYLKNAKAYHKGKINNFSNVGVHALNPKVLRVDLENPTPFFLSILQHYPTFPVHRGTIEKYGGMTVRGSAWTRPENIVTSGPFHLKRWDLNKVIEVVKSPTYWDAEKVKLKEIHFYPTESRQTEERMFRSGKLHKTENVPLNKIAVYRKKNPSVLRVEPYLGIYYYLINTTKKAFKDVRVRHALSLSIDRKKIVERVTKGGQVAANGFTPPGVGGYQPGTKIEFNPIKAKQLLAEAGYPAGKNFPTFEILYNTAEEHRTIAEAIQQMWKINLGLNVTLSNQDWKVYLDTRKQLNYDVARAAWIGDYLDPSTFLDLFVKDGGNNHTGWHNQKYDALLQKTYQEKSLKKRHQLFQEMEALIVKEFPVIPIYVYTRTYLIRPEVKGFFPNVLDHHSWKYVYLETDSKN